MLHQHILLQVCEMKNQRKDEHNYKENRASINSKTLKGDHFFDFKIKKREVRRENTGVCIYNTY